MREIKIIKREHTACIKIVNWLKAFCLRRRHRDRPSDRRDSSRSSLTSSLANLSHKFSSRFAYHESSLQSLDFESLSDEDSYHSDDENNAFIDFSEKGRMTEQSKMLAKESFETMVENEKLGDVLIVEACYILVGTKQEVHSLLFRSLKQLIDIEREVSTFFLTLLQKLTRTFQIFRIKNPIRVLIEVIYYKPCVRKLH